MTPMQSAGINVQSPQSESTPRRLTLGPRGRSKSGDFIYGCPYSVVLATAVAHYTVGTLLAATIAAAPPPRRRSCWGWRGLFNLGIYYNQSGNIHVT